MIRKLWNLIRRFGQPQPVEAPAVAPKASELQPVVRVTVTSVVLDLLFAEYARHLASDRGHEEIGWLLVGYRERDHLQITGALPAGSGRDAGVAHVEFNSLPQQVAVRILRQNDLRLQVVGVVHTHPGNLRRPSGGDFRGDSQWVKQIYGKEAAFGIGTSGGNLEEAIAEQGTTCVQCRGAMMFSWYVLGDGAQDYSSVAVETVEGANSAEALCSIWAVLESHASALERLYRQQARVVCSTVDLAESTLSVTIPMAKPETSIRLLLDANRAQYFVVQLEEMLAVDGMPEAIDEGVYLILAEMARRSE